MIQTPVTIISGGFGAGKTTLIERLIKANPQTRFAVLLNREDSDMADFERVTEAGGQALPVFGGCICCTLADSYVAAMLQLTAVRDGFDHLLIEPSGRADPRVVWEFITADPELRAGKIVVVRLRNVLETCAALEQMCDEAADLVHAPGGSLDGILD